MSATPNRAPSLCLALLLAVAPGDTCGSSSGENYDFLEFTWSAGEPDVLTDRLCLEAADPDNAPDEVFIDCRLEGGDFTPAPAAAKTDLQIMTWNIERGLELDAQIDWLLGPGSPDLDVILLIEADRGCSRTDYRNVARELAQALGMYYIFGVEFIELPRASGGGGEILSTCEHGNAILSRYPLGNARLIRHAMNKSWYIPPAERNQPGEPRLGGRMALHADARVGNRFVHLYALHFESDPGDAQFRDAQAAELADDGLTRPYTVVQGGDTNAPLYFLDLSGGTTSDTTTQAYFSRGYFDTHEDVPFVDRGTRGDFIIDLIFTLETDFGEPGRCDPDVCSGFSDHLPVWATIRIR